MIGCFQGEPLRLRLMSSERLEEEETWTQILANVKRDLLAVKASTIRGIPTLLAIFEKPFSF